MEACGVQEMQEGDCSSFKHTLWSETEPGLNQGFSTYSIWSESQAP